MAPLSFSLSGILMFGAHAWSGGSFLQKQGGVEMHADAVKEDLMIALYDSLAKAGDRGKGSLYEIGQKLNATYIALPKSDENLLDSAAVRYLCRSYFLKEYGWLIRGLEPYRADTSVSSDDFKNVPDMGSDDLPSFVYKLLSSGSTMKGFKLSDVVAMVAILRNLILHEEVHRLAIAYEQHEVIPMGNSVSEEELNRILLSYVVLITYVAGPFLQSPPANLTQRRVDFQKTEEVLQDAEQVKMFVQDNIKNELLFDTSGLNPFTEPRFTWADSSAAMMRLSREHGRFRHAECRTLKDALMELDSGRNGRVPLRRFYAKRHVGDWQLEESIEYLRQIGAVDESMPDRGPHVIIPNYVTSVSNCDHPSDYYAICCIHECEDLLNDIEIIIEAPIADPQTVLEVVGNLSSMTVEAPRNLSAGLHYALTQVADFHGGEVPLHSRLFAQWMHYAFPYECPYPHISQSFNPLTPEEWFLEHGRHTQATHEELIHLNQFQSVEHEALDDDMYMSQWTLQEEMRAGGQLPDPPLSASVGLVWKIVLLVASLVAFMGLLRDMSGTFMNSAGLKKKQDDFHL